MSDFPEDRLPDFCARCDRPILKDQRFTVGDDDKLRHAMCHNDEQDDLRMEAASGQVHAE